MHSLEQIRLPLSVHCVLSGGEWSLIEGALTIRDSILLDIKFKLWFSKKKFGVRIFVIMFVTYFFLIYLSVLLDYFISIN